MEHLAKTDLKDLPFGAILGIAGIVTLIGFFCPWAKAGDVPANGFEGWQGILTFTGSWLIIIGSMISYNLFNSETLEDSKPLSDSGLGIGGAILGLIGILAFLVDIPSLFYPAWGLYLSIAGAILALLSALILYYKGETSLTSR
ncbi:hypothetical protein AKJ45_02805, partial [candidate division MSBL1 archaeon SCGC-AAA261F19]